MASIQIEFGKLCAPIKAQLKTQGYIVEDFLVEVLQRDLDAINRLSVRNLITEEMASKAKDILMKKIVELVEQSCK